MLLHLYKALSILSFPFIEIWLILRIVKKKENKISFNQRFARTKIARPAGNVIWVHAVSVGEANSALTLIEEILQQDKKSAILITTSTLTSAQIVNDKLNNFKKRLIHQFLPIDSLYVVRQFLDFWQFDKAIFVESEIWPNLILEARNRDIKIYLVNARISEKSYKRWIFLQKFLFTKIFDKFDKIFVQYEKDLTKFKSLQAKEVLFLGDLKAQSRPLSFDSKELEDLKLAIKNRKILLCASTHKDEEEILLKCHKTLKQKFPDLLTIIIPRHPNRSSEISKLLINYRFAKRSNNDKITEDKEIYLVDSLGELGLFYKLADFAFIGGSIIDVGGHNPYEAINLDCAVISGDRFDNFAHIYKTLSQEQGCIIVKSEKELIKSIEKIIIDKKLASNLLKNAKNIIKQTNIAKKITININNDQ